MNGNGLPHDPIAALRMAQGSDDEGWSIALFGGTMLVGKLQIQIRDEVVVRRELSPVFELKAVLQMAQGPNGSTVGQRIFQAWPVAFCESWRAQTLPEWLDTKSLADLDVDDRNAIMGAVRLAEENARNMRLGKLGLVAGGKAPLPAAPQGRR